jgi:putative multiple sugar transport system substrate-binding protein
MKKLLAILMAMVLVMSLAACGDSGEKEETSSSTSKKETTEKKEEAKAEEKGMVGIAMPTKSSARWISDGETMKAEFEKLGYEVELQYAEDDITNQVNQIENMITKGAKVLVIAPIDNKSMTDVLSKANDLGIQTISYDRLILDSEYVSYYATFDNFGVGVLMGNAIIEGLDLENQEGPFNIELFAGSPDDNNSIFFFNGAMSVLNEHLASGKLVVQSEQIEFDQVATLRWDGQVAQQRMENLLTAHYSSGETVDAVLAPYDGLSIGIISALKSNGYSLEDMPYVTGQDAEQASVQAIIDGWQSQTVFKDTRSLAKVAVNMADSIINGEKPEVNDTNTYNNGVKLVDSYLLVPISVDINNWEEELVGSGYWSKDDFDL